MSLPILNPGSAGGTTADLLRMFARTQLHWARHMGEETQLDFGVAITSAEFPDVPTANAIVNVALPAGVSPADARATADAHFEASGGRCLNWSFDPSAPASSTDAMATLLESEGFEAKRSDILYLQGMPEALGKVDELRVIPARASYRHTRELLDEATARRGMPRAGEAEMQHLDDGHTDALVALRDGTGAAFLAVLSVGEIGAIESLYVAENQRGQGVGRTMMIRALEICARSLFRYVFVSVEPDNRAALRLAEKCGFQRIGTALEYVAR